MNPTSARPEARPTAVLGPTVNSHLSARNNRYDFAAALLGLAVLILPLAFAQDTVNTVMSPIASYQYPEDASGGVLAAGGAQTPIVSYNYAEDFTSEALGNGGIISPIASYQYYEWPGDDVLKLQSSPVVSYFYNWGGSGALVGLSGRVTDAAGNPLAGATVAASVLNAPVASIQSAADGSFELPALPPAVYALTANQVSFVPNQRVVNLSTATAWQEFRLTTMPSLPSMEIAGSTPPVTPTVIDPLSGAKLRAFNGTAFTDDVSSVVPSRMTIVLTHGWKENSDEWPAGMASALAGKLDAKVNLVAWDWREAAKGKLPPVGNTPGQGLALGRALQATLGNNYTQQIHFIGHSLGTLVNARAANYLHGDQVDQVPPMTPGWSAENTQMTLLDEAEIASIMGEAFVYACFNRGLAQPTSSFGAGLVDISQTVNISPIPRHYGWIDNYISAVGFQHEEAVNVCLQKETAKFSASDWLGSATTMHNDVEDWYRETVPDPSVSAMGFVNSFERLLLAPQPTFPPDYNPGSVFHQDEQSGNWLVVAPWTCQACAECNAPALGLIYSHLADFGSIVWPGTTGKAIQDGVVGFSIVAKGVTDLASGFQLIGSSVNGVVQSVLDLGNTASLRLQLTTGLPPGVGPQGRRSTGSETATNTPAYVWLPVAVPANAAAMVFDFSVSGDPKDDALAFGINGTNLFSLQGKFVNAGETNTSSLVDVSAYVGTTNTFFFGVTGGTSTNCTMTVEGIRFYTFAAPTLTITNTGGVTLLSWPTTAMDYTLETTATLSPPAWEAVTNAPAIQGSSYVLTNTWADQTRFFRLRQGP